MSAAHRLQSLPDDEMPAIATTLQTSSQASVAMRRDSSHVEWMGRPILALLALLAMAGIVSMPIATAVPATSTIEQPCHHHAGCHHGGPAHDKVMAGCALHCVGFIASQAPLGSGRAARADCPTEIRRLHGTELPPPFRPPIHHRST